jgi:hypothetical protein
MSLQKRPKQRNIISFSEKEKVQTFEKTPTFIGSLINKRRTLNNQGNRCSKMSYEDIMKIVMEPKIKTERGGTWKIVKNRIEFVNTGEPGLHQGIQGVRMNKIEGVFKRKTWHYHPHNAPWWPSEHDLKFIYKYEEPRPHLLVTKYGVWVITRVDVTKHMAKAPFDELKKVDAFLRNFKLKGRCPLQVKEVKEALDHFGAWLKSYGLSMFFFENLKKGVEFIKLEGLNLIKK